MKSKMLEIKYPKNQTECESIWCKSCAYLGLKRCPGITRKWNCPGISGEWDK